MAKTLYFYDLETTGFSASEARIMQFAGQRTSLDLKPIGEPHNILIKLSPDILPDPGAILLTGITPQQTLLDGINEADFLKLFHKEIVNDETIFVGFNSVRFDDEFMRYLHYRNFYDPYEWQWRDGRGKWDLLDVVRMTRALRPEGINWPIVDGKPSNRLELLTKENNISHDGAHDALADVEALIDLGRLIRKHQPKLFDFLLSIMVSKENIKQLINSNQPFVYTSGKYSDEFEKTTLVAKLVDHPKRQGTLVFDLRFDPKEYENLSVDELVEAWYPEDKNTPKLPIKALLYNRCPAIAPYSVFDEDSQKRIKLTKETVDNNYKNLRGLDQDFTKKILQALDKLDKAQDAKYSKKEVGVDSMLYDGFFEPIDKQNMDIVRSTSPSELVSLAINFKDKRLNKLLPLYKARNFPKSLSGEEIEEWEKYRTKYLFSGDENSKAAIFYKKLDEFSKMPELSNDKKYIIEELKLYAESIMPTPDY